MRYTTIAASAALLAIVGAAQAEETTAKKPGMNSTALQFPEACQTHEAPDAQSGAGVEGMGEPQRAFTEAMMVTEQPMMQGVMADDPDVGFACGMIAHHQAAINMAEVELQYGDDEQMQQMAQAIIDAQKLEIKEMTSWLAKRNNEASPNADLGQYIRALLPIGLSHPNIC